MRRRTTVSGTRDQRIAAVANLQRGRLARQQLLAIGVGSNTIDRLVRSGYLSPKHRGVYALHRVDLEYGDETAALLALRDGSVLSHQSAASLWGLAPPDWLIHATVPGAGAGATLQGVRVYRAAHPSEADTRLREGLPVTPLHQTLLFLRLIRQAELPAPKINVSQGGRERDYRWPAQRVLVEIDGYQFHGTHRAFDDDRRRDARASATGWFTTIRITYGQLLQEPKAVIARLAAALVRGENRASGTA